MGKANRERIARILRGEEMAISVRRSGGVILGDGQQVKGSKKLFCKHCRREVYAEFARQHIEGCWGLDLKDGEPIPSTPTGRKVMQLPDGTALVVTRKETKHEDS